MSKKPLKVKYVNSCDETLILICDRETKEMKFHHTDLHEENEYEEFNKIFTYFFCFAEMDVILDFQNKCSRMRK